MHALVHDVLGHERCAAAGGDVGGVVIQDLGLRFDGFVERQCLFNTVPPVLPDEYEAAGIPPAGPARRADGRRLLPSARAATPTALAAELDTPEQAPPLHRAVLRLALLGGAGRLHAATDVDFMTEPFADADKLRAELRHLRDGARHAARRPSRRACSRRNPVPTLVLYGPEDHVIPRDFPERCEVAFTERIGPFVVPRAGHFLQWERADVLNQSLVYFFADLRG